MTERVGILKVKFILVKLVYTVLWLILKQGGIKFEISWEPNFPVNNFARNNGKNRVINHFFKRFYSVRSVKYFYDFIISTVIQSVVLAVNGKIILLTGRNFLVTGNI